MVFDQKSAVHPVPGLIAEDNNKAMDIAIYKLNMPMCRFSEKKIESSIVNLFFMCIGGSSREGGSSKTVHKVSGSLVLDIRQE